MFGKKNSGPKYAVLAEQQDDSNSTAVEGVEATASSASEDMIELQIKMLDDQKVPVSVKSDSIVADLKRAVATATSIPEEQQRLIFSGQLLNQDNKLLSDFKVKPGSFIHLVPRVQRNTAAPSSTSLENAENSDATGITEHPLYMPPASRRVYVENLRVRGSEYSFSTHVWRSRASFLATVLMFFSGLDILGFMASAHDPPHHSENNASKVTIHHNSFAQFLRLWQDIIGCYAGYMGLTATQTMLSRHSLRFYKGTMLLALLYGINGFVDVADMVQWNDARKSQAAEHHQNTDSLWIAIMIYLMMDFTIWGTCVYVAQQFHRAVVGESGTENEEEPAENSTTDAAAPNNEEVGLDVV